MEIPGLTTLLELLRRVAFFVQRDRYTAELEDEMRLHQELRAARHEAAGVPPSEAARRARRQFGRAVAHVEASRDAWGTRAADALAQDVRYATRTLLRSPGLSAAVVLTLALGLGANAAIFSVLDRLFFRMPSGVVAPKEVVRLYWARPPEGATQRPALSVFDYQQYQSIRPAVGAGSDMVAYMVPQRVRFGADTSEQVFSSYADAGYFRLLGVHPALGRFFAPDEEQVESPADVMVLGYDFWHRAFGGDSTVIGRRVRVGRRSYTVIGVAQRGFTGVDLDAADFWRPLSSFHGFDAEESTPSTQRTPWYRQRGTLFLSLLARPQGGVAREQVAVRATVGLRRDGRAAPWHDTTGTIATGSLIAARGPAAAPQEYALSVRLAGVAMIVLLIACANVANLLLARATRRRRELAVRLAMGISRRRLAGMLLIESTLLAAAAGAAALLTAIWAGALVRALLLPSAHWEVPSLGARIVGFTAIAAVLAAFAAGLAPALQATRTDLTTALKSGAREGGGRRARLRASLVIVQSALSAVLLVGAGLFVRSLHNVATIHAGYDMDRLVFATVNDRPFDTTASDVLQELAQRLAALPGVERTALVSNPPVYGISFIDLFRPDGDSLVPGGTFTPTVTGVSPSYFATAGMRIVRGRGFSGSDLAGAARELVVNESMARRFWPGADPIGQCLRVGAPTAPCFTVVGVAEDALRMQLIEDPSPSYFVPASMVSSDGALRAGWVVARAAPGATAAVTEAARRIAGQLSSGSGPRVLSMEQILAPQLRPWRLGAQLFTAFGALALLVAAMGVYSTLTYTVSQRTNEIGVRLALGARAADVIRLVVGAGVRVVAAGVVAGILLALLLARMVASLVYGISPHDPLTLLVAAAVLLVVAAVAATLPAWRAARVDPVLALRTET